MRRPHGTAGAAPARLCPPTHPTWQFSKPPKATAQPLPNAALAAAQRCAETVRLKTDPPKRASTESPMPHPAHAAPFGAGQMSRPNLPASRYWGPASRLRAMRWPKLTKTTPASRQITFRQIRQGQQISPFQHKARPNPAIFQHAKPCTQRRPLQPGHKIAG